MRVENMHDFDEERVNFELRHFDFYDIGLKGFITRQAFLAALARSGFYCPDLKSLVAKIRPHENGMFTPQHYIDAIHELSFAVIAEDEIVHALRPYDRHHTGKAKTSEVAEAAKKLMNISLTQANALVSEYSVDGEIDIKDFASKVIKLF